MVGLSNGARGVVSSSGGGSEKPLKYARWMLAPKGEASPDFDSFPPWFAQLLHNRGLRHAAEADAFLQSELSADDDPFLLPDMETAVARLGRALESGELLAIYGDFDADGVSATVLLSEGIGALGGHVVPYIPHRLEEGYDLNRAALAQMRRQGVSLVITADCGISAREQVAYGHGLGLDVIITDHHAVTGPLPGAVAVVNPRRADSAYPFAELSGVGVAYKLLQGLLESQGRDPDEARPYLDLVALGTITDLSPLLGENRYLVRRGLRVLNATERLGLQELALSAGLRLGTIDAPEVSYSLGPRLNAAGRLDDARASLHLLSATSREEARLLAQRLEAANGERQRLTAKALARAREEATRQSDRPLIFVSGQGYGAGIIGLVAGRLCEEFYRPVVVVDRGDTVSRGSSRSIPEFNIMMALAHCQDLLVRFGGHTQAAGFSVANDNLAALDERLSALAESALGGLAGMELGPSLAIEAEVPLVALGPRALSLLYQLRPFGKGNPEPIFLSRHLTVVECRPAGSNGKHLRLRLRDESAYGGAGSGTTSIWPAIGFGLANNGGEDVCHPGQSIDIAYTLEIDEYRGEETLRLNLKDFVASGQPSAGGG